MYLARTMPPRPEVVEAFRDWDSCLEDCFEQLFPPGTWEQDPDRSRRARIQLHLPVRLGGFGIRAAASLSPLSYVCGWAQAARDIAQLGVAGEEAMFAEYLTTSTGAQFLDPWFGLGAGAWVLAVPAHSNLTFAAAEWGIAAAIRLGLPIQQLQVAGRCVCGTAFVDPADPHHALRCRHQHGPSRVHDEVKFAVAKISKASGGVVTMEDSVVLHGKRVDVAVQRPMAGEAHALEISVADPLSLSPSLLGQCGRQIGSLKALIGVALQRAQARVILLRAASSIGGINVDLVDRERDDVDVEGGAL
ncbi:unnamed protein product [Closterium sp. NIES-65]|nr:unnamed protein product [Closterium sp. NIES-65]